MNWNRKIFSKIELAFEAPWLEWYWSKPAVGLLNLQLTVALQVAVYRSTEYVCTKLQILKYLFLYVITTLWHVGEWRYSFIHGLGRNISSKKYAVQFTVTSYNGCIVTRISAKIHTASVHPILIVGGLWGKGSRFHLWYLMFVLLEEGMTFIFAPNQPWLACLPSTSTVS